MSTPWQIVVRDVLCRGTVYTADVVRRAYHGKVRQGFIFQALAQVQMSCDSGRSLLTQGYALEHYIYEKQWVALIACAHDSLFFEPLRFKACSALLTAALALNDAERIVAYGDLICRYHADQSLSGPQLVHVFFSAIVPYYRSNTEHNNVLLVRKIMYEYSETYSGLLYTYLQANLYAYTTDVAQELIGEPDVFARR
ncbi:MAG: hypothetical protein QG604_953 [Candidatus Dependentiae bacterium]|nr:hypothetical protein [Candidatus Dependentiae bacterium]